MANVDPIRRAEIGREKRARTRAQLVAAARSLFRKQPVESVTVDDVVREAGVAKGTFYVHFDHLQALTTAVADELVKSIDDLLQPVRLSLKEPADRIAFGCCCFIDKAFSDPGWAAVVARMGMASAIGGESARRHLLEDLCQLSRGSPGSLSPVLGLEIVVGAILQLSSAIGEGRLSWRDRNAAIGAILRAIGLDARRVKSVLARLPEPAENAVSPATRKISKQPQGAARGASYGVFRSYRITR
jgi:AcrR family transcriptional regulator